MRLSLYPTVHTDALKLELTGKKSDPCNKEEGDVISGDVEVRLLCRAGLGWAGLGVSIDRSTDTQDTASFGLFYHM